MGTRIGQPLLRKGETCPTGGLGNSPPPVETPKSAVSARCSSGRSLRATSVRERHLAFIPGIGGEGGREGGREGLTFSRNILPEEESEGAPLLCWQVHKVAPSWLAFRRKKKNQGNTREPNKENTVEETKNRATCLHLTDSGI